MLRKLTLISFAVPLLFVQACAQKAPFTSSEGRFSINLLTTPTDDKNSGEAKAGGKTLIWETVGGTFIVSYVDKPGAKKELAETDVTASAEAYIAAMPKAGEIVSRKNIKLDGYPGTEVKSREKDGYTVVARYYMVEKRLYHLMALWSEGPNDAAVMKALDSFKVHATAPPK